MAILIWALACPVGLAKEAPSEKAAVESYVRLHVIAADDTAAAQALKLRVRDAVLARAREMLGEAGSADEAWEIVRRGAEELCGAARAQARACGYAGPVTCETGVFDFPERAYGNVRVPAGDYRALRVVIGEGRGRNWWCVLFPSLCWPGEMPEEGSKPYSAIWNWLRTVFGGEAA